MNLFIPILLILTYSTNKYQRDSVNSNEKIISEVGFYSLNVTNGDTIKTAFNDGKYSLFYATSNVDFVNTPVIDQLTIDGNEVNISSISLIEKYSLAINANNDAILKFKSYSSQSSLIYFWLIPSSICTGNKLFIDGSTPMKFEFNSNDILTNNCLFVMKKDDNKISINLGYGKRDGKYASVYTSTFNRPTIVLPEYHENTKHTLNIPILVQFELFNNKFFLDIIDQNTNPFCQFRSSKSCNISGCFNDISCGFSCTASSQSNSSTSNIDTKTIIIVVVVVVVVAAVLIAITVICIIRKRAKKKNNTINGSLMNPQPFSI